VHLELGRRWKTIYFLHVLYRIRWLYYLYIKQH
jgi:hypothetical protein